MALQLNPNDNNYLTSNLVYNQLTENARFLSVAVGVEDLGAGRNKLKVILDGAGRGYIVGNIKITEEAAGANFEAARLPIQLIPAQTLFITVVVKNGTTYSTVPVKINGADEVGPGVLVLVVAPTQNDELYINSGPILLERYS